MRTLSMAYKQTGQALHAALWEAVHAGLIVEQGSNYKFLHDRIQQAAYCLIPEEQRAEVHVRLGRALLASLTAEELTEHRERLPQPAVLEGALDLVADRRPLEFGGRPRQFDLAAREVVVDRAAWSVAALRDVAELHPGIALLRQQLPGSVEEQSAPVAALGLGLAVGESGYAHGHSLCCGRDV